MSGDRPGKHSRRGFLQAVAHATAAGVSACALPGCRNLFDGLFEKSNSLGLLQSANKIPPMTAPPDAMQLDIVFAERPVGDPLIGDKLWQDLDQATSLTGNARDQLQRNGFRVGVSASRPHSALQTLLGLKSDLAYQPKAEKAKFLVGRQVMIRSDGETQIEASPVCAECTLTIADGTKSTARSFSQCRGSFKLVAHRLQDSWAKLDFLPIVLHGADTLRPIASSEGWQFENTQRSEVFHNQRFQLELGVGEMVVISADEKATDSLGHLFFVGKSQLHNATDFNSESTAVQRVLVVRLADMPRNEDPYTKPS